MKIFFFFFSALLASPFVTFSQKFCFAYTVDKGSLSGGATIFVSRVFDGEDFSGSKDYSGIKFTIKESLKIASQHLFGTRSYQYSFEVVSKNTDGKLMENVSYAGEERKRLIAKYTNKGYKLVEFTVEPQ